MSFEIKRDREGRVVSKFEPVEGAVLAADLQQENNIPQVTHFEEPEIQAQPDMVEEIQETPDYTDIEQEEVNSPTQPVTPRPARKEGDNARNLRVLRERADRADRAERERDEMARRLLEMEDRNRKNQTQSEPEEDLSVNVGEDDLAEGKHVNKLTKQIRKLQQQIEINQRQSAEVMIENKIKAKYTDFDKVVSADNIAELKERYPELSQTLNNSTDLYSQAVSAYTLIKELGIHRQDNFEKDRAIVQKNAAKPRPLTSIAPQQGESPLSKANAFASGLTDDLKAQLRREMEDARRAM